MPPQLGSYQCWWLSPLVESSAASQRGLSVFSHPWGTKGVGRWQKGQFGWINEKVRSNRLWVFRQAIWNRKKYKLLTYLLLQGVCAESFLLSVSFHFRKESQPPLTSICLCSAARTETPPEHCISCSISETDQLQMCCLSPSGHSKWYCLSISHIPRVWLCLPSLHTHNPSAGYPMPLL